MNRDFIAAAPNPVLHRPIELAQYTAVTYTEKLAFDGIAPSIESIGDTFDNALMETINGLYKAECIRTTVVPRRTLPDHRRRRIRDRRLGRLVQHS